MILSLALALLATAGGTLVTYLYDEGASLATRLCSGVCIGLAAFGLIGFVLSSFLGLTPIAIGLSAAAVALPFALLIDLTRRSRVRADLTAMTKAMRQALLYPTGPAIGYVVYYATAAALLWIIFNRAMIELPDGIYTGVSNNYGDLPFHLSVITGFAHGQNFPPEDPTYAGVRFTYPFLTDFISAIFVKCGASLRNSLFIENFLLAVAFIGVLHRWAWEMLRNRVAALLTPLLVFLNGGLGWKLLFDAAGENNQGLIGVLKKLPASFTVIPGSTWRWGNAISSLLVPQRGILLGLPIAVIVFSQWWISATPKGTASGKKEKGKRKKEKTKNEEEPAVSEAPTSPFTFLRLPSARRMIAAGVIAGLLPLVHAHSFVVVMAMGACVALWQRRFREWITFAVVASAIALPQMLWSASGSAVHASKFFTWHVGWDHGDENPIRFWLKNTGLFMPLLVVAMLWLASSFGIPRLAPLLSSFQGRISRGAFLAVSVSLLALVVVIGLPNLLTQPIGEFGGATTAIYFLGLVICTWVFAAVQIKRWHDIGYSGWLVLQSLILFPVAFIVLAFIKGTDGSNEYGDDPLKQQAQSGESERLLLSYLPFTLCFIIPNMMTLAPWVWDNIKVLFYWWLASAPLVALLLARLWQAGAARRALSIALLVCLTLAGSLDVASIVTSSEGLQVFDHDGVEFAELIKQQTPPRSLVIHAPVHNTPVFLTGRRSLMGYPGHIWTHGLEFAKRDAEIRRIYAGAPDADSLLKEYGVDYAVVGPLERGLSVNQAFFARFQLVGQVGEYRLYKITR
jgi:uncharacterized membrane protein YhaH (DUF805 family)